MVKDTKQKKENYFKLILIVIFSLCLGTFSTASDNSYSWVRYTNESIANVNSSGYWGGYYFSDYDMPTILTYSYNMSDGSGGSPAGNNGNIQFNDGGSFGADDDLFWDNTNKRLGVGTSSPAVPLVLQHSGTAFSPLWGLPTGDMALGIKADSPAISGLDFHNENSAGQVRLMARNNNNDYIVMNAMGTTAGAVFYGQAGNQLTIFGYGKRLAIGTHLSYPLIFGTNNIERMRIMNTTGNVGIGTTAPGGKFHIKADTNHNVLRLEENSGTEYMDIRITASGDMEWWSDGGTMRMRILDNSNVVEITEFLRHVDDTNTYLQFQTDRWRLYSGGENLIDAFEGGQDYVKLGDGGDVDINLNDNFKCDGGNNLCESVVDYKINSKFIKGVQQEIIPDDGLGTPALWTINPTNSYITIDCLDAQGCTITMGEPASILSGEDVTLVGISALVNNFADTVGVSELAGAFAMGIYDSLKLIYVSDRWVEVSRSNN